jgi:glycosyltransferase involved in cell wall biosynthesis
MKIAMMAQAGSVHTTRWATGLASRGHDVWVISNDRFGFESDKVRAVLMPGHSSASYFLNIPRVKKLLRNIKPDVVHSHYATGYGLWGTLTKDIPLIVTVWGTDIEDALRGRFIVSPVVRRVLRRARFITSPSDFLIDRTLTFEETVKDRIVRIPFGVPVPEISARKPIDEVEGVIHIIYAKSYRAAYAPEVALKSFALAFHEDNRLRLTMIGGGSYKKKLETMSADLGVAEYTKIRGWQDIQETLRLIENADMMLIPSRNESFGVSALEATSYGVPVIASGIGGLPEIIANGVNGILVPPDDTTAFKEAILKLAADSKLRFEMGQAGQRIAREMYDFEKCLDMMEDLYNKIL